MCFGVAGDGIGDRADLADSVRTGRAICIASGQGKAGSMNFDLEDDFEDHDGGKAMEWARKDGRLGNVWGMVGG